MIEKVTSETERPDPEVKATARRRFSAQEKLRILEEAEACTEPGEVGALVRREGIYFSYLSRWRRARDRGQLGNAGHPHGSDLQGSAGAGENGDTGLSRSA